MKPAFLIGVVLIILGVVALTYQGISWTQHKELFSVGSANVTVPVQRSVYFPPVLGIISLVGGVLLVVVGSRK
jgi:hypothetical protein